MNLFLPPPSLPPFFHQFYKYITSGKKGGGWYLETQLTFQKKKKKVRFIF